MNSSELKGERVRLNKSTEHCGNVIGKSGDSYAKKERGEVKFTLDEVVAIILDFELSFEKTNVIFFDSKLPFSNFSAELIYQQ